MNETKTPKATYKSAVEYALSNLPDAPDDIRERLEALRESLDKKSGENRKPTATQVENVGYQDAIAQYLLTLDEDDKKTVGDIIKECPAVSGFSGPKVTSLVTALVKNGKVIQVTDKRRNYYKAVR